MLCQKNESNRDPGGEISLLDFRHVLIATHVGGSAARLSEEVCGLGGSGDGGVCVPHRFGLFVQLETEEEGVQVKFGGEVVLF